MQPKTLASLSQDKSLSLLLEALSLVFLGIFLVTIIPKAFPVQLTNPQWQFAFIGELVNNGTVPLVGAFLTPLALAFNPDSDRLRRRRTIIKKWALAAAIGFLLLIPLQVFAGWKVYSTISNRAEQQTVQSARKLTELREAINTAPNSQELQARLLKIVGPQAALPPAQLKAPLPELKKILLSQADRISTVLQRNAEAQSTLKPDGLIRETIRIALSSLLYAIGFAFLSGHLPFRTQKPKMAFGWGSVQKKW